MADIIIFMVIASVGLLTPAILTTWFFGLRPFVAKHGRARVTAVNWLLSMWADWSTAREIEKEIGKRSLATRLFIWLWGYSLVLTIGVIVLASVLKQ